MTDLPAIRLFVRAGNPAVLWHAIDEAERLPYRLEAASSHERTRRQPPESMLPHKASPASAPTE